MTKYVIILIVLVLGIWFFVKGGKAPEQNLQTNGEEETLPNPAPSPTTKMDTATLHTNKGDITIEFYGNDAPNTVANFKKLAGEKFYDGIKFHRVIKGFMIQAGDPNSKDDTKMSLWGTGGPGYKFADEINADSPLYKTGYKAGTVAMANSGPNTNGSQFFVMHMDYPLPPLYTIFAHVTSGQDVVNAIATTPTGQNDRPVTAVVINSVTLN
jgi:cyclophilin family peptidyl-prolyl cis-trans isomerase